MNNGTVRQLIDSIDELSGAPDLTVEDALQIEAACAAGLKVCNDGALQARLMFRYAGAVAYTQERRLEAALYAHRAMELALVSNNIVLAVGAYCVRAYCYARHVDISVSMEALTRLHDLFYTDWMKRTRLDYNQFHEALNLIKGFEEYLDRLTKERCNALAF